MLNLDQQALAIAMVGETTDPPDLLTANVSAIAAQYDGKDGLYPGLEMLYTQRDLIKVALGACRANYDESTGVQSDKASQEAARLHAMEASVLAEIERLEALVRAQGGVAVGQLLTTTPQPRPYPCGPDANSPYLRGSPYGVRIRSPW